MQIQVLDRNHRKLFILLFKAEKYKKFAKRQDMSQGFPKTTCYFSFLITECDLTDKKITKVLSRRLLKMIDPVFKGNPPPAAKQKAQTYRK